MTRNFAENSCQEYVTELLSSTLKDTAIWLRVGEQERESTWKTKRERERVTLPGRLFIDVVNRAALA